MDLNALSQNKLLLQYLAGAGADISAGNPIGGNVNAVTQQNIQAQNFAKLLQRMLGGNVPEGGKITMDTKGMKMDIPQSALGNLQSGMANANEGAKLPGGSGTAWTPENVPSVFNPFR